eukprot:Hpha_TRINITY_DN15815_c2_g1::TRINITY_DN15815_c2_g1_i2::g.189628::m.189628
MRGSRNNEGKGQTALPHYPHIIAPTSLFLRILSGASAPLPATPISPPPPLVVGGGGGGGGVVVSQEEGQGSLSNTCHRPLGPHSPPPPTPHPPFRKAHKREKKKRLAPSSLPLTRLFVPPPTASPNRAPAGAAGGR